MHGEVVGSMSILQAIISQLSKKSNSYLKQINEAELLKKSYISILTIFIKLWQGSVGLCKDYLEAGSHALVANGFRQCKEFQQFQDLKKSVNLHPKSPHFIK